MWYVCDVLYAMLYLLFCSAWMCFRGELGFLNCDDICMYVVNKQFEFIEFVFYSIYVDLKYEISLTFTAESVFLYAVCTPVFVLGLSVRLS